LSLERNRFHGKRKREGKAIEVPALILEETSQITSGFKHSQNQTSDVEKTTEKNLSKRGETFREDDTGSYVQLRIH